MTNPLSPASDTGICQHPYFPAALCTGISANDRGRWLAARRKLMTASKTAALFGAHPFTSAFELYVDMVTDLPDDADVGINSPIFWGLALERAVLEAAAGYFGWHYEAGGELLRSSAHPDLGVTLDAILFIGTPGVYEGKTTSAWRAQDWNEETGEAPMHCIIQAQHQLLVTQADRAFVCCLIGGQRFVKIEVEPNYEFHALIVEETAQFMDRVRRRDPPEPDGSLASTRAMKRLFPVGDGSAILLPDVAEDWTRELQEIAAQVKTLKRRKEELRNLLKRTIGEHTYGVLPQKVGKKSCWRWDTYSNGARVLKDLNTAPYLGQFPPRALPPPTLESQLEASLRLVPEPPPEESLEAIFKSLVKADEIPEDLLDVRAVNDRHGVSLRIGPTRTKRRKARR